MTFNIALSGQDAASVGSYADRKLLLGLLTLDASGNPAQYSGTVVKPLTVTP